MDSHSPHRVARGASASKQHRFRPGPESWRLALCACLLLTFTACNALGGVDVQGAIETSVYQTEEVGGYQTAIAEGGDNPQSDTESAASSTPEPQAAGEECTIPQAAPDIAEIDLPEGLGELTESGGAWYLNEVAVVASYQSDEDCGTQLWLSLAEHPDWPLYIRDEDGSWDLGASHWTGKIVVINTNDVELTLGILPLDISTGEDAEPQIQELTAYEIFNVTTIPPGRYEFSFSFTADDIINQSCTLNFTPSSSFVFSVVPIGVAVFERSFVPSTKEDINIATSPLCMN